MKVQEFFDPATFTLTYVVFDPRHARRRRHRSGARLRPARARRRATGRSRRSRVRAASTALRVHYVLETHAHADHLIGLAVPARRGSTRRSPSARASARCRRPSSASSTSGDVRDRRQPVRSPARATARR